MRYSAGTLRPREGTGRCRSEAKRFDPRRHYINEAFCCFWISSDRFLGTLREKVLGQILILPGSARCGRLDEQSHGWLNMDRRTISTLLLPLMAILALIYPVAFTPSRTPSSRGTESRIRRDDAQQGKQSVSPEARLETGCPDAPYNAKRILCEFFGYPGPGEDLRDKTDRRYRYQLDFLIVTIPDPLDSRLPYLFDRNLSSIQRAAEADHFLLDRFDLPWIEEIRTKAHANEHSKESDDPENDDHEHHSFKQEPGFILFRDPNPEKAQERASSRALLVFLVGETPTTGIHKRALVSALDQIRELCGSHSSYSIPSAVTDQGAGSIRASPRDQNETTCGTIKILGPSFSGSAESLDFALHAWLDSRAQAGSVHFRIRSGTATAVPFFESAPNCSYFQFPGKQPENLGPTFASTVVRDTEALNELLRYLQEQHFVGKPFHVALLTEGNTAYGSSLFHARNAKIACPSEKIVAPVVKLPFPLHISRLRSESEKVRRGEQRRYRIRRP
jgi:hypothetical protein